jgi:tetrahydromethanopterin S-methyltransferase subunit A
MKGEDKTDRIVLVIRAHRRGSAVDVVNKQSVENLRERARLRVGRAVGAVELKTVVASLAEEDEEELHASVVTLVDVETVVTAVPTDGQ